ncbi:hypothetical protein [Flagellimonas meridianipacifica]|uniref:Uncharacterized protein n=1 Tax=Flagellimonas meridianipacifica TaxID=1080225 RepID=A0A2T0MK61_9FLAO|nr:hypothetical protein [Allomuricauda pacifica]PRX57939.1 hypothetical protein CLV81_1953 [Allomuricauda pacifica]
MRLRLGSYSLKIKSYTAQELGLKNVSEKLIFNVYQKVFHIWYVPIFPVEKHWKILDGTTKKEVEETNSAMRSALDLKMLKKRSPFWSYTGLIIVALPVLFLLGYVVYGTINVSSNGISKALAKNTRISEKQKLAQTPEIGDLYTFKILSVDRVTDMNGQSAGYKSSYFSSPYDVDFFVNYISKDSVGFDHNDIEGSTNYTFGLKRQFKLAKSDIVLAAQKYQDLSILEYPNEEQAQTKKIVGIFQIQRD